MLTQEVMMLTVENCHWNEAPQRSRWTRNSGWVWQAEFGSMTRGSQAVLGSRRAMEFQRCVGGFYRQPWRAWFLQYSSSQDAWEKSKERGCSRKNIEDQFFMVAREKRGTGSGWHGLVWRNQMVVLLLLIVIGADSGYLSVSVGLE
jgi:hypothetical protein